MVGQKIPTNHSYNNDEEPAYYDTDDNTSSNNNSTDDDDDDKQGYYDESHHHNDSQGCNNQINYRSHNTKYNPTSHYDKFYQSYNDSR